MRTVVYSPESALRHPAQMVRNMAAGLWGSRWLSWRLFVRDLSAMYRQSVLGYVWAFLPPILAGIPLILLNSQGVVAIGGTGIPYSAYALLGTTIWQVFTDALVEPLKTVNASKTVMARINCPRESFLVAGFAMVFFNFLVRLTLIVAIFAYYGIGVSWTVLLFFCGILILMLMGFLIGVAVAPLGLLYTDVQYILPVTSMFLMYMTPVLYPVPQHGLMATLERWNPLSVVVVSARDWLIGGPCLYAGGVPLVAAVTLLLFVCIWVFYHLALPHVVARIGN